MAPSLSEIYAAVRLYRPYRAQQYGTMQQTQEDRSDVRCVYCNRKERLLTFRQLKRGDHICMGGAKLLFNLGAKQVCVYTHHAIVKQVEFIDDSRAILTLIHFIHTLYYKTIKFQETREMMNIVNDEIYVIKYSHQTRDVDNIIDRAESLIDYDLSYEALVRNCETLAHWCVMSREESLQATSFLQFLYNLLPISGNAVGFIFRNIRNVLTVGIDDAAQMIVGGVSGAILFGVMTILYGFYCKYKIKQLSQILTRGDICSSCFGYQQCDIWLRFGAYVMPQLLGFIATPVMCSGVMATIAVCSVLSLGLMWGLPKLRSMICTPFKGKHICINELSEICIGDIVSFNYCGMAHDGIVSAVYVPHDTRGKEGIFKMIHYALPYIISPRQIRENAVYIDLNNMYLKLHDYTGYDMHPPEEVIARARMRLGETKFGIFSNRSCHFCHWAKVKEATIPEMSFQKQSVELVRPLEPTDVVTNPVYVDHRRGAKHATKTLATKRVIIRDDLTKGRLIQFKYGLLWHKAISTDVKAGELSSRVLISLVHYGPNYTVTEELMEFDLRHDEIYIYMFHPLYMYKPDVVISRARMRIGEQRYNLCTRRSSYLAEEAICKDKDTLLVRLDEIEKGDVIIFRYWSLMHEAIVSDVIIDDANTNYIGSIKIIHYALSSLLSTREILEEYIHVHLQRDSVYIKSFPDYTMYPNDMVVKRARGRLGERRFHSLYNTSFDFVHWAKVIQQPSVISVTPVDEAGVATGAAVHEVFLFPRVGPTREEFQVDWIKTWDELKPGNIVEYKYYLIRHAGIVSAVHPRRNTVTVIHYGTASLFSRRTIMEDNIHIDLKTDRLWVYRCDPTKCNPLRVIVENARARVGEQKWESGNRSWDFCKACTLKKYIMNGSSFISRL